jgi:hypothetical protein
MSDILDYTMAKRTRNLTHNSVVRGLLSGNRLQYRQISTVVHSAKLLEAPGKTSAFAYCRLQVGHWNHIRSLPYFLLEVFLEVDGREVHRADVEPVSLPQLADTTDIVALHLVVRLSFDAAAAAAADSTVAVVLLVTVQWADMLDRLDTAWIEQQTSQSIGLASKSHYGAMYRSETQPDRG